MSSRYQLGKVFISHSSADKPFVRKLVRAVEGAGFRVWLDEKELIVGDALPQKISEGVAAAAVVLVVVSSAAIQSRWLRFELNHATQRMVEGKSRIIPLVIDDAELPAEVAGLLYADFTKGWATALKSVLTSLEHDARAMAVNGAFWSRAEQLLSDAFGSTGSIFGDADGYRREDFSAVFITSLAAGADDITVPYETLTDYQNEGKPVPEAWATEFTEELERYGESYGIVVTQRPLGFAVSRTYEHNDRVHVITSGYNDRVYSQVVYADLSGLAEYEKELSVVKAAKDFLTELANEREGKAA